MATKLFSRLSDVRGMPIVGQPKTSVRINIPAIGRLLAIKVVVTRGTALATVAEMQAAFDELRLYVNSTVVRKIKYAEYVAILAANGLAPADGLLYFFLAEPWRATVQEEDVLALALGGRYASAAFEIDITQPATGAALALEAAYEYDMLPKLGKKPDGSLEPLYGIICHTEQIENPGAGSPIIPLGPFAGALQRLFLFIPATADITRVQLLQSDSTIFDRYNTAIRPELAMQLRDMGMVIPGNVTLGSVATKCVPLVPDNNQRLTNVITDTTNLRLQLDLSAAVQLRIVYEWQGRY
jgi:hypothetical protein